MIMSKPQPEKEKLEPTKVSPDSELSEEQVDGVSGRGDPQVEVTP